MCNCTNKFHGGDSLDGASFSKPQTQLRAIAKEVADTVTPLLQQHALTIRDADFVMATAGYLLQSCKVSADRIDPRWTDPKE